MLLLEREEVQEMPRSVSGWGIHVPCDGVAGVDWGFSDIILTKDNRLVYYWWLA